MISFVGAGPGAVDLITLRGANRLAVADVVLWAGSLVPETLLDHCRPGVIRFDSKGMTLEQVVAVYDEYPDAAIVRLHSGDPAVFSAIAEQVAWCVDHDRDFEVVPGVSSMAAAAAAAGCELTVPGLSQSVVITRLADRTAASVGATESVSSLAAHGVTMALFLSTGRPKELEAALLDARSAYTAETPALVAHRVSWADERILRTTVGQLAEAIDEMGIRMGAIVLIGDAVGAASPPRRSHVYASDYAHTFRSVESAPPADA